MQRLGQKRELPLAVLLARNRCACKITALLTLAEHGPLCCRARAFVLQSSHSTRDFAGKAAEQAQRSSRLCSSSLEGCARLATPGCKLLLLCCRRCGCLAFTEPWPSGMVTAPTAVARGELLVCGVTAFTATCQHHADGHPRPPQVHPQVASLQASTKDECQSQSGVERLTWLHSGCQPQP